MELHLHFVAAREFIKIDTIGHLDKNASIEMLSTIVKNHPEGEDLLLDLRNAVFLPDSTDEIEEVVIFMIDHLRVFRNKIAIIGKQEKSAYPGYFEQYAQNSGLYVRVFREFEDAIRWILGI